MSTSRAVVTGVLLAAGAGTRMGRPKALVTDDDGAWLPRACRVLRDGGCDDVLVVLGARADEARALLEPDVAVVVAPDWADGMSASVRAGLGALDAGTDAAMVHLVDLPDVGPDVVRRLLALAAPDVLARATYGGGPGHPVLLGRDHWAGVVAEASGDHGARGYLRDHAVTEVDCSDRSTGRDVDRPPDDAGSMLGR